MPANTPNTMRRIFTTWASLETGMWPIGSCSAAGSGGVSVKLNSREVLSPVLSRASMATLVADKSSVGSNVKVPTNSPWTLPASNVMDWPFSAAVTRVGLPWIITFTLTCFFSGVAVAPIFTSSEISIFASGWMGRVIGEGREVGGVGVGALATGLLATGFGVAV